MQYKCQRTMDDDLDEVCRYRLALRAINTVWTILEVGAAACSKFAEQSELYGLLRPLCRHGTSGAVGSCS